MALKLPNLPSGFRVINSDGTPTNVFQIWWQGVTRQIEAAINGVLTALEAAGIAVEAAVAAQESADAAQAAAEAAAAAGAATTQQQSLLNSGIINVAIPPLISADDTGDITISAHERRYGDPALNPTVAVDGGVLSTIGAAGQVFYVYYDDSTRSGGAVAYNYSTDANDAVQGGNRHSVGAVAIPALGNQDGNYVQPPGVVAP